MQATLRESALIKAQAAAEAGERAAGKAAAGHAEALYRLQLKVSICMPTLAGLSKLLSFNHVPAEAHALLLWCYVLIVSGVHQKYQRL